VDIDGDSDGDAVGVDDVGEPLGLTVGVLEVGGFDGVVVGCDAVGTDVGDSDGHDSVNANGVNLNVISSSMVVASTVNINCKSNPPFSTLFCVSSGSPTLNSPYVHPSGSLFTKWITDTPYSSV